MEKVISLENKQCHIEYTVNCMFRSVKEPIKN
jgi:hypothetical protein